MNLYTHDHLAEVVERFGKTGHDASQMVNNLVAEALEAANAERDAAWQATHPDGKVNPSVTDAGKCPRAVWLSLTGQEQTEPLTTDSLVNFGIGGAIEEWLGGILGAKGVTFEREVRLEIEHGGVTITGRIDFLFTLSGRLIELKSISSRQMGMMLKSGEAGRENHRKQANLYLHAARHGTLETEAEPPTEAYLVYIVKDATRREPPVHSWYLPYDEAMAVADLDLLATIAASAAEGNEIGIPADYLKQFNETGRPYWMCNGYCSYIGACWERNENGKIIGPKKGD